MKKLLTMCMALSLVGGMVFVGDAARLSAPDDAARAALIKLYKSLSEEQKKQALLDFKDKDRHAEVFPASKRKGIPYANLNADQKGLIEEVVRSMTSDYGAQRCLQIPKETGETLRFLTFFGEPSAKTPFAWRIGTHHLTLIFAEFGSDRANEFGPILLGGNPVKAMWDEEDAIFLQLYAALTPEEVKNMTAAIKGASSNSGAAMGKDGKAGLRIGDLNDKARKLAASLFSKRLDVFSADRRKIMEDMVALGGGVDNLRLAVWGTPAKSFHDGATYHWRIGSDSVVCDWQTLGNNHIHMTLRGRAKG